MLIIVKLPEAEEKFQFDLEDSATIAQLKSELEDETSFSPERQNLYFVGIFLDSNFDNVCLIELLQPFSDLNMDVEFVLYLPKASDNTVDKKWLVLGTNFRLSINSPAKAILTIPVKILKNSYKLHRNSYAFADQKISCLLLKSGF